ncbi:MAG: VCBS repeat-containing protein [Planctomycetes bacterium]|nr:VCBS repeat-containing protein [Planctomycetota bacterium]
MKIENSILCCDAVLALFISVARGGEVRFKKTAIDREFRSEGVAVADVDGDGKKDIIAWPFWYRAPDWNTAEIAPVKKYDPAGGYSDSFLNFAEDLNGDGRLDLVFIGFPGNPALWFENPGKAGGHWKQHAIYKSACNESPAYLDLNGDGKRELLMGVESEGLLGWFEPGKGPEDGWIAHAVNQPKPGAPGTNRYWHGLGAGDVNGDGRLDVIINQGWWEAPPDRRQPHWTFHPAQLSGKDPNGGDACAQMFAFDIDGDGDADIASSSAHNYGVWWYEQKKDGGKTGWVPHAIEKSFSQTHALLAIDLNRDGLTDLVTGKRWYAHGPSGDPGSGEPAVLVWFELERNDGKVNWIRHDIDNDSGVGLHFEVADVNGDGMLDLAISNKKGVFYFEQMARALTN